MSLLALSSAGTLDEVEDVELRGRVEKLMKLTPWPPGVTPYEYQRIGVAFAHLRGYRALIGDAMGLGKTAQAIGCLNLATRLAKAGRGQGLLPALVVAPSSVSHNWVKELRRFGGKAYHPVLWERGEPPPPRPNTVYVVTWSMLQKLQDHLPGLGLRCAIFDESHTARNLTAGWTKAALNVATMLPHVLLLSGTPVLNRPAELWVQLRMLDPERFSDQEAFDVHFADAKKRRVEVRRHGQTFYVERTDKSGAANLEELAVLLREYMVRRLKTQVLDQLPEKTRTDVEVELGPEARRAYDRVKERMGEYVATALHARRLDAASRRAIALLRDKVPPREAVLRAVAEVNAEEVSPDDLAQSALVAMGHLRRLVGELKVPHAVRWVEDFYGNPTKRDLLQRRNSREGLPGLVVFAEHRPGIKALHEALTGHGLVARTLTGSDSAAARAEVVEAFQRGTVDVLICSQAAYAGITLTRASEMLFLERWWVPAYEEQAEDRIHRIGQKNAVNISRLMAAGTIDDHVRDLVDKKRDVVQQIIGAERVLSEGEQRDLTIVDEGLVSASLAKQIAQRVVQRVDLAKASPTVTPHEVADRVKERLARRPARRRSSSKRKRAVAAAPSWRSR